MDRFNNPYIDHRLLDIALNSTSKWKARVLPSAAEFFRRTGTLPKRLTFSFAAYIAFYRSGAARDEAWILDFFKAHQADSPDALVTAVVRNEQMWNGGLSEIPGFAEEAAADLKRMEAVGVYEAMKEL